MRLVITSYNYIEDPLLNLTPKNKSGVKYGLKAVSQKQILKFLKKMKKKQSAGVDGLSQDKLVLGAKSLVYPLLQIVNQSIRGKQLPYKIFNAAKRQRSYEY